ncbi:MAG: hypothetical protein [Caudoviricetes sp.]|nr:MAG: hypothetical protein [Caudoviricetes sp.]
MTSNIIKLPDICNLFDVDYGIEFSIKQNIPSIIKNNNKVIFQFGKNTRSISSSYLIGMFESSYNILPKSIDGFYDNITFRYNYTYQFILGKMLYTGINRIYNNLEFIGGSSGNK